MYERYARVKWVLAAIGIAVLVALVPLVQATNAGRVLPDVNLAAVQVASLPSPTAVAATPAPAATAAVATPTPLPAHLDFATVRPNELGRIMILEYHQFGPKEDRWTRSLDNFRKDIDRLYRSGYRPINVSDYINNHIDVPAGMTPIILTFDDSSPGQLTYIPGPDGKPMIDPNTAVGILVDFNKQHPDWRLRGTFYVLAGVAPIHRLFGQPEYAQQKLQQLVQLGFEIGNHTYYHVELAKLDEAGVRAEVGQAVKSVQALLPGYQMDSLALPLGSHPKVLDWAVNGSYQGTEYHNRAILEVTGGGAYSPNNVKSDLMHLPRIQGTNMEYDFYTNFLDYYDKHPDERYISDGNPDRVVFPATQLKSYKHTPGDKQIADPATGYLAFQLR